MAQKQIDPQILNLVQRYKKIVEKKIPVQQMIIFGSQVKGTAKPYSDIDVAVVSPRFGQDCVADRVELSSHVDKVDLRIEPHPYHPRELHDRWDSLAQEILKYGIKVK